MTRISKVFGIAISALLASLGFSCVIDFPWDPKFKAEYGVPHATYRVKGVVVSETGDSPIEGIRTSLLSRYNYLHEDPFYYTIATAYTNSDGFFLLEGSEFPNLKLYVKLIDVNDDSFVSLEKEADFTNKTFTGSSGNWYQGSAEIDLGVIKMEPIENN